MNRTFSEQIFGIPSQLIVRAPEAKDPTREGPFWSSEKHSPFALGPSSTQQRSGRSPQPERSHPCSELPESLEPAWVWGVPDSVRRPSAVDQYSLASDVAAGVTGEEQKCSVEVLRLPMPGQQ